MPVFKFLLKLKQSAYNKRMSIKFVDNLDEQPQHGFYNVGSKVIFATVKSLTGIEIKPTEFIDGMTGEHVAFGIPVVV